MIYKWTNPFDWLEEHAKGWNENKLRQMFWEVVGNLDADQVQDLFQKEMDEDGYFEERFPQWYVFDVGQVVRVARGGETGHEGEVGRVCAGPHKQTTSYQVAVCFSDDPEDVESFDNIELCRPTKEEIAAALVDLREGGEG